MGAALNQRASTAYLTAALIACVAGVAAAEAPRGAALVALGGVAAAAWVFVANRSSPVVAAAVLALLLGLTVPTSVSILATLALGAFVAWHTMLALLTGDRRWILGALCLLIPAAWLLIGLNPNIPDSETAVLGTRKMTVFLFGLGTGILWPRRTLPEAERVVTGALVLAGVVCLAVHLLAPGYESSLPRAADIYTSFFRGATRMQGIYSGPFHIALLGAFLALRGWHIFLTRKSTSGTLALGLVGLGAALMYGANVRTAFLTVAAGAILTLVVRPPGWVPRQRVVMRAVATATIVGTVLAAGFVDNAAISSITELQQDQRATSRVDQWRTSLDLFAASPLVGQGAGAAGAAMGDRFSVGNHVTPHNQVLAILVEGGILGVALFAALIFALARAAPDILNPAYPSSAAAFALLGFSLPGTVSDALPISLLLLILIGLRVPYRQALRRRTT